MTHFRFAPIFVMSIALIGNAIAEEPTARRLPKPLTVSESLVPYSGTTEKGVDLSTIDGKVMCGYQGWFMAREDGQT